ncbi:MAG: energy-coupling factor transporter transmembrane protein EcfT [Chloroflexi bacterium]|nr:energy-coupling factor transporter transmembrane protein EcfT [Chloroflexota bacterium]
MSRSFYLTRPSGLHALHPLTKLVGAFSLVLAGFLARWPHLPIALFLFVVLPIALVQGLFYPGASHVLLAAGPLSFKQEGLVFAYVTAGKILLLAGAGLLLLFSTQPSDLTFSLQERGMPNALAYIVVAAIQLLPQMQARAAAIVDAQRSRGLETEGTLVRRASAVFPLLAPLVFGALADVDERAMALEARAFSSGRVKTSYKELVDTRAQAVARWLMLAVALAASLFERVA